MTSGDEGDMESGAGVSNLRNSVFKDWCGQFRSSNPWMARYVYGLLFLVANLLAWAARDYGHGPLTELERKVALHHIVANSQF